MVLSPLYHVARMPLTAETEARIYWSRRQSKGEAHLICSKKDVEEIVKDFSKLMIGGQHVRCYVDEHTRYYVTIDGIPRGVSEQEIYDKVTSMTRGKIFNVSLLEHEAVSHAPEIENGYVTVLTKIIIPFISRPNFQVHVDRPKYEDTTMEAILTFDSEFYQEAAKALEYLRGKILTDSWIGRRYNVRKSFIVIFIFILVSIMLLRKSMIL